MSDEKYQTITLECRKDIELEVNFETGEIISNLPPEEAESFAMQIFPPWIWEMLREGK